MHQSFKMLAGFLEKVFASFGRARFAQALLAKPANQPANEEEHSELNSVHTQIEFQRKIRLYEEIIGDSCRQKSCEKARAKPAVPGAQGDRKHKHQVGNIALQSRLQKPSCKQGEGNRRQGDAVVRQVYRRLQLSTSQSFRSVFQ